MSDDITTAQKALFLETTIQIDRIIGPQEDRDSIKANIQNRRVCTSGHVLGEFNRVLIKDAIVFRNLLLSSPNVDEAVKRLAKYVPVGRKFIRTIVLLASLGNDGIKQNVIDRLEDFIDFRAHQHFWESMDRSICTDSIGCFLRSWQSEKDENGQYDLDGFRCLKNDPPPCTVPDFIEKHREALERFVTSATDHSRDNVAKSAQAFKGILSGSDVPFGERSNCYPISDTLIVLEANDDAEIYSTDGDVHAICEILGKNAYVEVPSA